MRQESRNLQQQVEALRTRDPKDRDLKSTRFLNAQIKLYKAGVQVKRLGKRVTRTNMWSARGSVGQVSE